MISVHSPTIRQISAPRKAQLTGVSGFQVHIGAKKVYTPGDKCDVLVAMNAAALKPNISLLNPLLVSSSIQMLSRSQIWKGRFQDR